ncbi:hypothetical protein NMG60_11029138 [Bertholletia excelsa]
MKGSGSNGSGGGGPCGACKFLRRKCVTGCVFAPYFDADQGTARFAAVHKVFGASNAAKLLLGLPVHRRIDAAITLCYEALARLRDPVYGCVAHIFILQQQVVNLQAELAFIQARLSTMQCLHLPPPLPEPSSPANLQSSSSLASASTHLGPEPSMEVVGLVGPEDGEVVWDGDGDLQTLAQEFLLRYLPSVKLRPTTSP